MLSLAASDCNDRTRWNTFIAKLSVYAKNYERTSILYRRGYGAFSRGTQEDLETGGKDGCMFHLTDTVWR